MICITGDVHHSIESMDQQVARSDEVHCALRYADLAALHRLKVTLFVTGRALVEHRPAAQELARRENVSMGGHTYSAFRPRVLFKLLRSISNGVYGPPWYQRWDVARTVHLVEKVSGAPCTAWRTHAFRSNQHTYAAVRAAGVRVISDEVTGPDVLNPRWRWQLLSLPINTHEDHTHLYHGLRTSEHVKSVRSLGKGRGMGIGPDSRSYTPREWASLVLEQVESIVSAGGLATLLVHPICMHVADDFKTFEELCSALGRYQSIWAQEALDYEWKESPDAI